MSGPSSARSCRACSRASRARSVCRVVVARQLAIRREQASVTQATTTKPRHAATSVSSATQRRFGRVVVKCRCSRSSGRCAARSGIVVRTRRPRRRPCRPLVRNTRASVPRATGMPSRGSCRPAFRARYRRRLSIHTRWVSGCNRAPRCDRAEHRLGSAARARWAFSRRSDRQDGALRGRNGRSGHGSLSSKNGASGTSGAIHTPDPRPR